MLGLKIALTGIVLVLTAIVVARSMDDDDEVSCLLVIAIGFFACIGYVATLTGTLILIWR